MFHPNRRDDFKMPQDETATGPAGLANAQLPDISEEEASEDEDGGMNLHSRCMA
jgi:hypothetical protein